ncbi:hypothetical protein NDU88_006450 [Pleurodeles waltl]|uniref:Uncharacterized protein n=1 Tax=Pleurodeles waltl TaxID=8319 RepID=A0AAV7TEE1_PLEWA|nr:hypothetical protein NDU88_006450 [Pleurodeles waltl]
MAATSDSFNHRAKILEESSLGGARKMAAPLSHVGDTVVISSEDEVEEQGDQSSVDCRGKGNLDGVFIYKEGKIILWVPRVVSPMLHKVHAWEVDNQAVFKVGEQVEFVDSSGLVLRGTVCGKASGDGKAGRVQVMFDLLQSGQGEGLAGFDSPHVFGGHGDHAVHQQFGRLAGVQSLLVKVGRLSDTGLKGGSNPERFTQHRGRQLGMEFWVRVMIQFSMCGHLLARALVPIWST